jgi:hypothetical protein
VWQGRNSKLRVCLIFKGAFINRVFFNGGMIFMHVHKHWLDHDVAALAFLIVGIAAVELLAIII